MSDDDEIGEPYRGRPLPTPPRTYTPPGNCVRGDGLRCEGTSDKDDEAPGGRCYGEFKQFQRDCVPR